MDTMRAFAGWLLFLLMAVIAAFFWYQSDMRGRHIEQLNDRIIEISAQVTHLTDEIAEISKKIDEAQSVMKSTQPHGPDTAVPGTASAGDTTSPTP